MKVTHIENRVEPNRHEGTQDFWSDYDVESESGKTYRVNVRCSHSGTPQEDRCNCHAFKYSKDRTCKHIKAVYDAGVLYSDPEW